MSRAVSSWPQTPSHATSPAAATTSVRPRAATWAVGAPRAVVAAAARAAWAARAAAGARAATAPARVPSTRSTHGFHANAGVVAESGPFVWYSHHARPSP